MGGHRFDSQIYSLYSASTLQGRSASEVFQTHVLEREFDPREIVMRESRDSAANPESTPVIIGLDVTGSMGMVLNATIRNIGTLMETIYDRRPITDPHIMCMGIGDVAAGDNAPLQVTQFEADIKIAEQLQRIYIERGGGGNGSESYTLPWYFAATKTSTDCFEKRGKKGYIFTVGDEPINGYLTRSDIDRVCGNPPEQQQLSARELYAMVSEKYYVYHLMVEEGNYMSSRRSVVVNSWTDVIGEQAIVLPDHNKLVETIVTAIMINEGSFAEDAIRSWNDDAANSLSLSFNLRRD